MSPKVKASPGETERTRVASAEAQNAQPKTRAQTPSRKRSPKRSSEAQPPQEEPSVVPVPQRAVFIDVENTTAETRLLEVLRSLELDRQHQKVEITAVGNWRAVPPALARRLASMGAKLIHSAPARGVRDWSDLWIATAAGCWLGQAHPGDVLEVISDDRAFDAIGDLAAARGVAFRRIPHMRPPGVAAGAKEHLAKGTAARRKVGGVVVAAAEVGEPGTTPHAASAEQIVSTIEHLTKGEPGRWVNLDVLERALKEQGFVRPPGSPRLVTRLRALRQVEVDSHGRVRLRLPEGPQQAAENTVNA